MRVFFKNGVATVKTGWKKRRSTPFPQKEPEKQRRWIPLSSLIRVVGVFSLLVITPSFLSAQEGRHILIDQTDIGARTPGNRIGNWDPNFFQPVRFQLPEGTKVEVASERGFQANLDAPGLFGLRPGDVYRFKLTEIPYHAGKELYPTIEMLGHLSPPPGHETEFPIPIEFSQEDLELAFDGNLITRVVFLDPPQTAIPLDSTLPAGKILIESPPNINPVALAESRGRLMAILRVGSRIPDEGPNPNSDFYFGLAPFTLPTAPVPPSAPVPSDPPEKTSL